LALPTFYDDFPGPAPSWQYWALNRDRFGILIAIDGRGQFVFHTQLPREQNGSLEYARESLALAMGRQLPHDILAIAEWTAGLTLVAEYYGSNRAFLAGDAAHLFTPTAGLGYNTSVDDVSNLGWKLAAVIQGWGGAELLPSYERERKPIAERNTRFARSIAEFFREIEIPAALEEDGSAGDSARAAFGPKLHTLSAREFDAPGIHFGIYYGSSPIVQPEAGEPPPTDPAWYVPHARPGARAPHAWVAEAVALYDLFGRDFTLLSLSNRGTSALEAAAQRRGMPMKKLQLNNHDLRQLYGRDFALIRPDQHVAWRGNTLPENTQALIDRSLGFGASANSR
jgi:FAD binding domain